MLNHEWNVKGSGWQQDSPVRGIDYELSVIRRAKQSRRYFAKWLRRNQRWSEESCKWQHPRRYSSFNHSRIYDNIPRSSSASIKSQDQTMKEKISNVITLSKFGVYNIPDAENPSVPCVIKKEIRSKDSVNWKKFIISLIDKVLIICRSPRIDIKHSSLFCLNAFHRHTWLDKPLLGWLHQSMLFKVHLAKDWEIHPGFCLPVALNPSSMTSLFPPSSKACRNVLCRGKSISQR